MSKFRLPTVMYYSIDLPIRFRFLHQWGVSNGFWTFSPFVIFHCPAILGYRHCFGVCVCNFGLEIYWGRA